MFLNERLDLQRSIRRRAVCVKLRYGTYVCGVVVRFIPTDQSEDPERQSPFPDSRFASLLPCCGRRLKCRLKLRQQKETTRHHIVYVSAMDPGFFRILQYATTNLLLCTQLQARRVESSDGDPT
ncbi:hypothetical protein PHSY_003416 [Pseudozyma hubeiensis SY62]|uniref:Uncharacterized protein n=1 Tax=Pseudozyma hubeiensis (strain SY62) TaxID=1305764 RepID=R9P3I5_PSEHS|nr:hypothetical protein PHSY_003416 [Pseudozyma hubeiensis SY62]GAC95839.1 hypothetical protein PHSY_003416 [Pseudozyma hubeiensis SY62]